MSKFIHPITTAAAEKVANNLRPDDRREVVEGHGYDPLEHLLMIATDPRCVYFTVPDGDIAGLAGVAQDGQIWMLCTPAIHRYPVTFARESKRFVEARREKLLYNIVDERNKVHLKLLKFLGFKVLRKIIYGPNNITFIEFCRVCQQPIQSPAKTIRKTIITT